MRKIWLVLIVMVLGVSCFGLGLVFALWLDITLEMFKQKLYPQYH